jgi:hypothetical protein
MLLCLHGQFNDVDRTNEGNLALDFVLDFAVPLMLILRARVLHFASSTDLYLDENEKILNNNNEKTAN